MQLPDPFARLDNKGGGGEGDVGLDAGTLASRSRRELGDKRGLGNKADGACRRELGVTVSLFIYLFVLFYFLFMGNGVYF